MCVGMCRKTVRRSSYLSPHTSQKKKMERPMDLRTLTSHSFENTKE